MPSPCSFSPHFRGYNRAGLERTRGALDWRKQFDIGAERPARSPWTGLPPTRLQGPNQWPAALPKLKPVVLEWQERIASLSATPGRR